MIRSHRHMLPKGRLSRTLPWLLPEHFLRHLDFLVSPSCACSHLLLGKVQGDNDANSYRPSRSNAPAAIRNPSSRSSRSSQCPRHASAYVSTRPLSSLLPVYVYKKILTNYYSTRWSRPPLPSAIPRSSRPRKPPPSTSARHASIARCCTRSPPTTPGWLPCQLPHTPRSTRLPTSPASGSVHAWWWTRIGIGNPSQLAGNGRATCVRGCTAWCAFTWASGGTSWPWGWAVGLFRWFNSSCIV